VRRIVALGGSAVHGFGFTRAGAWPDQLEGLLARAWEGIDVEVINAGVIAWSSQQVLMLVKDLLAHHSPDALLIYSGNNELLEWFDARQYLPPDALAQWVSGIRWSRRARGLRTYQLLDRVLGTGRAGGRNPGHWGQTEFTDDEALPWEQRARLTEADRRFAVEAYRRHLSRILDLAHAAGVPVVLSTVAVNETETPAEFPFGKAEPGAVVEHLEQGLALFDAGDEDGADSEFQQALEIWPEAITHYRWGMALRERGAPGARDHLRAALDLDENPHRATARRNEVVRSLSRRADAVVDVAALLSTDSQDGIVDTSQIYDYCHPTPAVHSRIAKAFAEALAEEVWPGGTLGVPPYPGEGHVDGWLGEGVDPARGFYIRDPGTELERAWRLAQDGTAQSPDSAAAWQQQGLVAWHGFHADCERGKFPCLGDALTAFHTATTLDPDLCAAWANLGRVQFTVGMSETGPSLSRAVACDPEDARSAWYLERWGVRAPPPP
jgi:lysophospholipase L1-like esterase